MKDNSNLQIVKRLLELSKNQLEYSEFPKAYNKEHIFLANVLNDARQSLEREFADAFKIAVGRYKASLEKSGEFGWFHKPEELVYLQMQIDQLKYAVYGESSVREIKFNESLGKAAYKDLIEQIDRTVLMNEKELEKFRAECERLSAEVLDEILAEEAAEKKQ